MSLVDEYRRGGHPIVCKNELIMSAVTCYHCSKSALQANMCTRHCRDFSIKGYCKQWDTCHFKHEYCEHCCEPIGSTKSCKQPCAIQNQHSAVFCHFIHTNPLSDKILKIMSRTPNETDGNTSICVE